MIRTQIQLTDKQADVLRACRGRYASWVRDTSSRHDEALAEAFWSR